MSISFAIIGKNCDSTIESIRQFPGVTNVVALASKALLNRCLEKPCDFLCICDAGDSFAPNYTETCLKILQENDVIGAVYTDYNLGENRVFLPSFCRQRLVRGIDMNPNNCFLRRSLLSDNFFKEDIFLDFSDKFAMYHIAEPLVSKTI